MLLGWFDRDWCIFTAEVFNITSHNVSGYFFFRSLVKIQHQYIGVKAACFAIFVNTHSNVLRSSQHSSSSSGTKEFWQMNAPICRFSLAMPSERLSNWCHLCGWHSYRWCLCVHISNGRITSNSNDADLSHQVIPAFKNVDLIDGPMERTIIFFVLCASLTCIINECTWILNYPYISGALKPHTIRYFSHAFFIFSEFFVHYFAYQKRINSIFVCGCARNVDGVW